ncbi:MAG: D-alanyl-D-alanine carboxypeptidase/D-alanyl-D-alanine-endopeptidase [Longimicrobiales bacterium]
MTRAFVRALGAVCLAVVTAGFATAPSSDLAIERLGTDLVELLDTYRWRGAEWGVLVVSLDRGDTLFAVEPATPRAPASNVKLLTSAAALAALGPDYRFRTWLVTDGTITDGVLHGDLVLYGTGDPGLSDRFFSSRTAVFEALAEELRDLGIHTVRGDLVGDASFLPGPLRSEAWDPADLNDHFAPGVSALSFNENVVSVRVEPGSREGLPPVVHTLPDRAGLDVANTSVTVEGRPREPLLLIRDDPMEPIRIEGRIQRGGRDVWRQLTVSDPARFAVSVFRSVLEDSGVRVSGNDRVVVTPSRSVVGGPTVTAPRSEARPRTRVLARHVSPPLREYLAVVNKRSNNLYAELLYRTLGRLEAGVGSPDASAVAVARALSGLGVEMDQTVQVDGSGLADTNRVTPGTFVSLFRAVESSPLWPEFWASLPEAGERRGLGRMYDTPAAGNLRAKTGTIARVSALSGVVRSADGERLAFSMMVNGTPSTGRAKRVENAVGARLASFERETGGLRP